MLDEPVSEVAVASCSISVRYVYDIDEIPRCRYRYDI